MKSFQPKTVTLGKGIHPVAAPEGSVRIDKKAISEDVEVLFNNIVFFASRYSAHDDV